MMRRALLCLLVAILLAGFLSFFTVDRTEYVYVTQFGKPIAAYDGAAEAGAHWKWPWPIQSVQRLDRRVRTFDLPSSEFLTRDARGEAVDKTLTIDAYVCWRIDGKEGVDRFIRAVGTVERAKTLLSQRLTSRLGAAISSKKMDDLISVVSPDQARARAEHLRAQLLDQSDKEQIRQAYGIDVVDIRIRRANHPEPVRAAIFERIVSERNRKVADYRSEGERVAKNILSEAERDTRKLLTEARTREQQLKAQAEADADRIRNQAHAKDPEFYAFLKKLEEYQRILGDNKTTLLLSSHRELFDLLFAPPKPKTGAPPIANSVTSPPRKPGLP